MIAIAYTLSFCFLGAQMIRWLMPRKSPLVRAWLGVSLGVLMEMGLPALCANALDFTVAAHIAAVAAAGKGAALRDERGGQAAAGRDGRRGDPADGAVGLSAIYA